MEENLNLSARLASCPSFCTNRMCLGVRCDFAVQGKRSIDLEFRACCLEKLDQKPYSVTWVRFSWQSRAFSRTSSAEMDQVDYPPNHLFSSCRVKYELGYW